MACDCSFGGVVGRRSIGVASATTLHCCIGKQHEDIIGGGYYEECEEVLLWVSSRLPECFPLDGNSALQHRGQTKGIAQCIDPLSQFTRNRPWRVIHGSVLRDVVVAGGN